MVANSPMRVKGNLYAGRKNDHWLALKPDPPNNPTATSRVGSENEVGCTAISSVSSELVSSHLDPSRYIYFQVNPSVLEFYHPSLYPPG